MFKNIVAIVLLLGSLAFAGDSVTDIIEEVQEKYENAKNLTAVFEQQQKFNLTGSVNQTAGTIYVKDGVKYRLETEDNIIVTDGKTVWTYSKFNNQVMVDRVKEGDGSFLPRDMLFKYPKEYISTLLGEEKILDREHYLVKLDPRDEVFGAIKSMKIWVDEDDYVIRQIEYTDMNDNVSTFTIRVLDMKKQLSDSLFTFKAEEGVEVIDLRM